MDSPKLASQGKPVTGAGTPGAAPSASGKTSFTSTKILLIALAVVTTIALIFAEVKYNALTLCVSVALANPLITTCSLLLTAGAIGYLIYRNRSVSTPSSSSQHTHTNTTNATQHLVEEEDDDTNNSDTISVVSGDRTTGHGIYDQQNRNPETGFSDPGPTLHNLNSPDSDRTGQQNNRSLSLPQTHSSTTTRNPNASTVSRAATASDQSAISTDEFGHMGINLFEDCETSSITSDQDPETSSISNDRDQSPVPLRGTHIFGKPDLDSKLYDEAKTRFEALTDQKTHPRYELMRKNYWVQSWTKHFYEAPIYDSKNKFNSAIFEALERFSRQQLEYIYTEKHYKYSGYAAAYYWLLDAISMWNGGISTLDFMEGRDPIDPFPKTAIVPTRNFFNTWNGTPSTSDVSTDENPKPVNRTEAALNRSEIDKIGISLSHTILKLVDANWQKAKEYASFGMNQEEGRALLQRAERLRTQVHNHFKNAPNLEEFPLPSKKAQARALGNITPTTVASTSIVQVNGKLDEDAERYDNAYVQLFAEATAQEGKVDSEFMTEFFKLNFEMQARIRYFNEAPCFINQSNPNEHVFNPTLLRYIQETTPNLPEEFQNEYDDSLPRQSIDTKKAEYNQNLAACNLCIKDWNSQADAFVKTPSKDQLDLLKTTKMHFKQQYSVLVESLRTPIRINCNIAKKYWEQDAINKQLWQNFDQARASYRMNDEYFYHRNFEKMLVNPPKPVATLSSSSSVSQKSPKE